MSLREARKKSGFTLRELSEKVGVTAQALSRYENGMRSPKTAIAKKIGAVLNIPWYDLVDNKKAG